MQISAVHHASRIWCAALNEYALCSLVPGLKLSYLLGNLHWLHTCNGVNLSCVLTVILSNLIKGIMVEERREELIILKINIKQIRKIK